MAKTEVNHHSSVVIIPDKSGTKLITNFYNEGYPRLEYQNAINLVGGNDNPEDLSPLGTLKREIEEEFSGRQVEQGGIEKNLKKVLGDGKGAPKNEPLASKEETYLVRGELLYSLVPHQDYLLNFPASNGKSPLQFLHSVHVANPKDPDKLFEVVKDVLERGEHLVNEGFLEIISVDDLISGKIRTAWGTAASLGKYLDKEVTNHVPGVKAEAIGMPRGKFTDYYPDFKYAHRK